MKSPKQSLLSLFLLLNTIHSPVYADTYDLTYGTFSNRENAQVRLERITKVLDNELATRIYYDRDRRLYKVIGDYNIDTLADAKALAQTHTHLLERSGLEDAPFASISQYDRPEGDITINQEKELLYDINYGIFTNRSNAYTFRAEIAKALDNNGGIKIHHNPSNNYYYVYGNYDLSKNIVDRVIKHHFEILLATGIAKNTSGYMPRAIINMNGEQIIEMDRSKNISNSTYTAIIGDGVNEFPTLYRLVVESLSADGTEEIERDIAIIRDYNEITNPRNIPNHTTITIPPTIARTEEVSENVSYEGNDTYYSGNSNLFDGSRPSLNLNYLRTSGPTRNGNTIDTIILHTTEHDRGSTSLANANYISNNNLANFFIGEDGTIYQILPTQYRSHGAGYSLWDGKSNLNYDSINIEIYSRNYSTKGSLLPASQAQRINDKQYESVGELVAFLQKDFNIPTNRVLTHYQVAINPYTNNRGRKGDPPQYFDWAKIGLPNNWLIEDPDIASGRAHIPPRGAGYSATPGMRSALK